jgi:hypothetical protein
MNGNMQLWLDCKRVRRTACWKQSAVWVGEVSVCDLDLEVAQWQLNALCYTAQGMVRLTSSGRSPGPGVL